MRPLPIAPAVFLGFALTAGVSVNAAPWVEFDTPATLACREVSDAAFTQLHPGERLWEARFRISTLMRDGDPDSLLQFFLTIDAPGNLLVTDYLPKTTLASSVAGNVAVKEHNEQTKSLGLTITGSVDAVGKLTGNGLLGSKNARDLQYELIPPHELVASSGTLNRGRGVYFKLKPTRKSTLEGGKDYVIVFRAPAAWRASRVRVQCESTALSRSFTPLLNEKVKRRREFAVTMYAGGDAQAKAAAESVALAEHRLRRQAEHHQAAIRKRAHPSPLHQFGTMLSLTKSKIPTDWLQRLIAQPTASRKVDLFRLPEDVRAAATEFISAARRVEGLQGVSPTKLTQLR